jgi:hypothetical protein
MLGPVLAAAARTLDKVSVARLDVLAWDFAFPLDAEVRRLASTAGVDLHLRRIPAELLDLDAVDRPRITEDDFAPLRELALRMTQHGQRVSVTLTDFVMPPVAIPRRAKAQAGAVSHWWQWIDYWAVDWEHREGTFCNAWRAFRRPGTPDLDLPLQAEHEYPQAGTYLVAVKVVDLLGEETVHVHPIHLRAVGQ